MEFHLSDFCISKLSFFDSDFNGTNFSLVKCKGALFLLYGLNDESAILLIEAFKCCFFLSVTTRLLCRNKEVQMEVKNQNILIYQVE